jgi:outer membrane protein
MKNLIFSIILILATGVFALGQTESGKVLIGTSMNLIGPNTSIFSSAPNSAGVNFGSAKFKSGNFESDATNFIMFNLSPKVGFFMVENGLLGIDLTFLYMKEEDDDAAITEVGVGPFFRYYFPAEKVVRPFVHAQAGIGQVSFGEGDEFKTSTMSYNLGAGGVFFLSEKVSFDLMFGYYRKQLKEKSSDDNSRVLLGSFGLAAGLSIFL